MINLPAKKRDEFIVSKITAVFLCCSTLLPKTGYRHNTLYTLICFTFTHSRSASLFNSYHYKSVRYCLRFLYPYFITFLCLNSNNELKRKGIHIRNTIERKEKKRALVTSIFFGRQSNHNHYSRI